MHAAKPHTPAEKSTDASGPGKPRQGVVKAPTCTHLSGLFTVIKAELHHSQEHTQEWSSDPFPCQHKGSLAVHAAELGAASRLHTPVLLRNPCTCRACTSRALRAAQVLLCASTHTPRESLGTREPAQPQEPTDPCCCVPHKSHPSRARCAPTVTSSHLRPPSAPGWAVVTHMHTHLCMF